MAHNDSVSAGPVPCGCQLRACVLDHAPGEEVRVRAASRFVLWVLQRAGLLCEALLYLPVLLLECLVLHNFGRWWEQAAAIFLAAVLVPLGGACAALMWLLRWLWLWPVNRALNALGRGQAERRARSSRREIPLPPQSPSDTSPVRLRRQRRPSRADQCAGTRGRVE